MKFLIIGTMEQESFASHINETLLKMGHSVLIYNPVTISLKTSSVATYRINQFYQLYHTFTNQIKIFRRKRIARLWALLKTNTIDVTIFTHDFFWPEEVRILKEKSNSVIVMWFPDHLANFGRGFFMNAPYDFLFFKDPYIVKLLKDILSPKIYYLPECFNPYKHLLRKSDVISNEYICDITTAGNFHSWRTIFFKHLSGYNVKFWGNPPPLWMPKSSLESVYQGKSVFDHDKAKAFLGAKIVINNLHFAEMYGLNARAFEAAGIGAFQMVDWRPGIEELFKDGQEIIMFKGIADLKHKLDFWLSNSDGRSVIAEAGKIRAYKEHTYQKRLELMIDTIFNEKQGFKMPNLYEVKV